MHAVKKLLNRKKKKYNEHTTSDRFQITNYGMENSSRRTASTFQKGFRKLNVSTVRAFMKTYVKEQEHKNRNGPSGVSIPVKKGGRPMLGSTDGKVRDFLILFRYRGGIVSSTISIAVAKAFIL